MGKLREIAQSKPELHQILMEEPLLMPENEFLSKFSLLWNLSKKEDTR